MKLNRLLAGLCLVAVFGPAFATSRNERDIGLHLKGDHHHDDHHSETGAASSRSETKGYGRDIPDPALPVSLEQPAPKGYPRENPPNPLKLDEQAATAVEVRVESDAGQQQQQMMGGEIPGNPGDDYPIFDSVPETKFNCKDFDFGGYFADVDEGRCQVFHVCHDGRKFSFLCPNGTIFDQKVFVCNWWFNVDCAASKDLYELNKAIGVAPEKPAEKLNTAASTVDEVDAPGLEYLPPKQEAVRAEPPPTAYLPPTAEEALTNGIIKTEPVVAEPEQSYLPPEPPKAPEQQYLPPSA